jgi:hypothetical protein
MSGYTAAVLAVAAIAGAGVSAYSSMEQGKQQKKMYEDQAQQAANEGAYKQDAAKAQAEKIRRMGAAQKGEAKAALAASGVKLGEGTALEVDKNITRNSEEDALNALLGGNRGSQASMDESSMLMRAGSNAKKTGNMNAAGTVLSTAGSLASGWKSSAKASSSSAGG